MRRVPQILYSLFDYQFVYMVKSSCGRVKLGKTKDLDQRIKKIDRSTPKSKERYIAYAPCFGGSKVERRLNRYLKKKGLHKPYVGSGYTEYFKSGLFTFSTWAVVSMELHLRWLAGKLFFWFSVILVPIWVISVLIPKILAYIS